MQATQRGGLTGKARSNRHRNRVQRMRAEQMLDEYFYADDSEILTRPIPLRGRAEFLPTIDSWSQEDATFETGNQLELTLQPATNTDETNSNEVVELQLQIAQETSDLAEKSASENGSVSIIKVIPAPYWARPRAEFQPQGKRVENGTFDFRRFVYGCALGTAAAAAILLVVNSVVH